MAVVKHYEIGVSVGKGALPTAIGVVEIEGRTQSGSLAVDLAEYRLRHLERLPLSASYPDLAKRLRAIRDGLKAHEQCTHSGLSVDITGTGRSIIEYLKSEDLKPVEVWISGGITQKEIEPGLWRVAQTEIVGLLQTLFHDDKIKCAVSLEMVPALKEELANYNDRKTRISADDIEAWRENAGDDLVFATALAVWNGKRAFPSSKAAEEAMLRAITDYNAGLAGRVV